MSSSRGFDRVAEGLPVGILRLDARGLCRSANPSACAMLGLTPEEALDSGWLGGLAQAERRLLSGLRPPAGGTGQPPPVEVVIHPVAGGREPRTLSLRALPVRSAAGALTGWTVVLVDVSEWLRSARELEDQVRASVRELRERLTHLTRVSTMGEMASSIAHEVNQPLTAVTTYAQACRRLIDAGEVDLSDVREVLERIAHEALRAGDIIHRLKDLVRRQESRWGEADLNALVRDVAQLADVDARHHDVRLSFHLTPDLPPVLADGVQVQQVVLNLIRNGIDAVDDAHPDRREVTVRTGPDGPGSLRLSVDDEGAGVPPEAEASLFRPFFTTKQGGTGMGLSISRSIVAAHHGRIGFERRPGGGSTFYFTLPVLDDS